ncbi:MAG: hypothetical protein E2O76_00895 [Caldithrix sp.]|nr:MAG: hypothetical protein E2O76_00895 [Caldithrix sp.]
MNPKRVSTAAADISWHHVRSKSILLSIIVGATGGAESNLAGVGLTAMFFPALAVLIMKFFSKRLYRMPGGKDSP